MPVAAETPERHSSPRPPRSVFSPNARGLPSSHPPLGTQRLRHRPELQLADPSARMVNSMPQPCMRFPSPHRNRHELPSHQPRTSTRLPRHDRHSAWFRKTHSCLRSSRGIELRSPHDQSICMNTRQPNICMYRSPSYCDSASGWTSYDPVRNRRWMAHAVAIDSMRRCLELWLRSGTAHFRPGFATGLPYGVP